MGICLSREGGIVPRPADLGLPRKFTVFRELGAEGGVRTYLMRERLEDGRSENFVAMVLERGPQADVEFVLRGIKEQFSLSHVNIVRLQEVILTGSHLLIKFEYAAGGALYGYISKQYSVSQDQLLSEQHARFFFKQLLEAVAHCHEEGVTQRGIELSHILIDGGRTPRVKLQNFKLERCWRDAENYMSYATMESALHMPPEVVKNILDKTRSQVDASKSDVWSLGVVLFVMLLGRFPFKYQYSGTGMMTSLNGHLTTRPHPDFQLLLRSMEESHMSDRGLLKQDIWGAAKLSNDCRHLLNAMFAMEPSQRIGLNEIMQHPWVSGPLFLKHAQMIAACWNEMDNPQEDSGRLKDGSKEDEELSTIVHLAKVVGSRWFLPFRWVPPSARLLQGSCNGMIAHGEFFEDMQPLVGQGRL